MTTISEIDTTIVIPATHSILEASVVGVVDSVLTHQDGSVPDSLSTLVFEDEDSKVTMSTTRENREILEAVLSKVAVEVEMKERTIPVKSKVTEKRVTKEADNPIKNFFFILGIVFAVLIILYIVLRVMKPI